MAPSRPKLNKLVFLSTALLTPHPRNPRKHTHAQIRAIAKSMEAFGVNAPILIDKDRQIVAGHGRWQAAKMLNHAEVPVVCLDHLSPDQAKAYMLADNKLTDRSSWDEIKLAQLLKDLSEIALNFDIEDTGFEAPEIDIRLQSLEDKDSADREDQFELAAGPPITIAGDTWFLGGHRVHCGDALEDASYVDFFPDEKAAATFADPPYNLKIDGHVSGTGAVKHREFAMASGEMSEAEFIAFLCNSLSKIRARSTDAALIFVCMDWRHIFDMCSAGRTIALDLINLCVWSKTNAGLGSLYRSQHELVFVFRNGKGGHVNNVQLGRFGRNRTNVWHYPGVTNFAHKGTKRVLEYHPTVKPILLISDAILDSTKRGDIILDPFIGSGTSLLAAERTGRRCYGIEIDPLYIDTAIQRWQRLTGQKAKNAHDVTFDEIKAQRDVNP